MKDTAVFVYLPEIVRNMRSWICAAVAVLMSVSVQQARERPYVVFWNLENYFDPFDDTLTLDDEFTPEGYRRWTWYRFEVKRNQIARTIVSMHDAYGDYPLAVAFAEVENHMVLRQLTQHTQLAKLDYGIVHMDSPDSRGIDVALIYRRGALKLLGKDKFAVRTERGRPSRDILYVCWEMKMPSGVPDTLCMFVNHWPSKFGGDEYSRPFRQAASDTLARAVNAFRDRVGKNAAIIVTGDFNDTPDSGPVKSLVAGTGLACPALPLHEAGEGTIKYNGKWELIDLFMVSGFPSVPAMEIYRHPMLLEKDVKFLGSKPFRTFYGPRWNGGPSDHLPIVLLIGQNL